MRRRTRDVCRPAVLVLLLLAIFSTRASQAFSSADLVGPADHPAQFLEGGIFSSTDNLKRQLFGGGRRLWMPQMEAPYQEGATRLKCPSVATAFTDGGGSLQLCLLLLFCAAVLCCASLSISPWYKSESYVMKKTRLALSAGAALFTEKIGSRVSHQPDGRLDTRKSQHNAVTGAKTKNSGQLQATKAAGKKSAKKKKGRAVHYTPASESVSQSSFRPLEKRLSSSSAGEASSVVSADTDADSIVGLAKEESVSLSAPADVQIARLEAEAARQKELRAAKSNQNARRQAAQVESSLQSNGSLGKPLDKVDQKPGHEILAVVNGKLKGEKDQKPSEVKASEGRPAPAEDIRKGFLMVEQQDVRPGKRERSGKQPPKGAETAAREPAARRGYSADRPAAARQSQVLVVPRKLTAKARQPVRTREWEVSDEDKEVPVGPATPDRANSSTASTFSSPHSSIYSPHHLSRPYAQVARGDLPSLPVPPPPPPPPRVSTLPPGAVFAREFVPASSARMPSPTVTSSNSSSQANFALKAQPAYALSVSTEPPSPSSSSAVPTSSPSPSPFPGMSLHRRLANSSPPAQQPGADPAPLHGYVFDSLKGGLGFPGVFDNIWSSNGAIGGWTLVDQQNRPLSLDSGIAPRLPHEHFNFEA